MPSPAPPPELSALLERFDPSVIDEQDRRARVRLEVTGQGAWEAELAGERPALAPAGENGRTDALLRADPATWRAMAEDLRGGMRAFGSGKLRIRHNLHVGVAFLAATSGADQPGRLRFRRVRTELGTLSTLEAGTGPPLLLIHGLGGTKASFLPTVAALAGERRTIAVDLPGFGDSDKPVGAYDAPFLSRWMLALLDALELERPDVLGHSLGGRVALELGFEHPDRVAALVLMTPSLAWLRERRWASWLRLVRPELGLIQPAPRVITDPIVRRMIPDADGDGWGAIAADEFLRSYLTPRGRTALYAAARQIYLEDPETFWSRLERLEPRSLFIWGRRDTLVPHGFRRHVEERLPAARHVEVDSGHVPQLEAPRATHQAIAGFLRERGAAPAPAG